MLSEIIIGIISALILIEALIILARPAQVRKVLVILAKSRNLWVYGLLELFVGILLIITLFYI